ncbi:MAG: TVP38/TMEM64 family protein [Acidobacteriota bacterium]
MARAEQSYRAWFKFGLLVVLLILFYVVGRSLGFVPAELSAEAIQDYVLGFGILAPLVYIGIYAIGGLVLFPGAVLSISSGLAFGWKLGFLVVVLGSNLNANLAFALGKLLGRDLVELFAGRRLQRFDRKAADHGFKAIFFLRLVPLVPFEALNYGAGLSLIRWRHYAAATFLGMLPGNFAYVYLGGNLNYRSWRFWLAMAALLLLAIVPFSYRRLRPVASAPASRPDPP